MRRFQALLFLAGLLAAPASAVAKPSDQPFSDSWQLETFDWSSGKGRLGVMVMSLTDELRAHFGAWVGSGISKDFESEREQRVARQNGGCLVERDMNRGLPAPQVVIVHAGQIVVDQRMGVDAFHGESSA